MRKVSTTRHGVPKAHAKGGPNGTADLLAFLSVGCSRPNHLDSPSRRHYTLN